MDNFSPGHRFPLEFCKETIVQDSHDSGFILHRFILGVLLWYLLTILILSNFIWKVILIVILSALGLSSETKEIFRFHKVIVFLPCFTNASIV